MRHFEVDTHLFCIFSASEEEALCFETSNAIQILFFEKKRNINKSFCLTSVPKRADLDVYPFSLVNLDLS